MVADATILGEDLVLLEADYFADAHAGVYTECEDQFVARGFEQRENIFDLFGTEDFCLSGHG